MNPRALLVLPLMVILLFPLALPALTLTPVSATSQGSYEQYDRNRGFGTDPSVEFIKSERTQSGIKFYYEVTAGSKKLNSFTLYSPAFKKAQLLSTSESPVEYNAKWGYIRFNRPLNAFQSKIVWFELKLNYDGYKMGVIPYTLVSGSGVKAGFISGPLWASYEPPQVSSLTVTSPNGGESWTRGTVKTLKWTSSGNPGANVKIELLKAGVVNKVISSSTDNDGSYTWTIPSTQTVGSDYRIRITSTTKAVTDTSNANFAITGGVLTVTSPNGGESWTRGTVKAVTWASIGNPGANVKIELLKGGVVNRVISSHTSNDGLYCWTIPSTQTLGSDYRIRITSTSAAITDTSNANFAIIKR